MNVADDDNSSSRMANQIRRKKSQLEGDLDDGLTKRKQKKSKEFFNLFMKQGQNIEDEYTHHNVKNELRE